MAKRSGGMVTTSIRARLVRPHRERDYYDRMLIHVMCSKSFLYVAGVLSCCSILKVQAFLHIGIHLEGENHSSIALVRNYAHKLLRAALHKERVSG